MKSHLIAAAVLASSISTSAFAAPIYSESFDTLNTAGLTGQDGWTGGNSSNASVVAPGLAFSNTAGAYSYINANAAKGVLTGTQQNTFVYDNTAAFSLPQQTTYFSFLLNAPNVPVGAAATTADLQPLRLFTTNTTGAGLGVRLNAGTTGDVVMTAIVGTGLSGGGSQPSATPNSKNLLAGVTYLVVGKIEFDVNASNDRISLWAFDSDDSISAASFASADVAFEFASVIGSERTSPIANSVAIGRTNNIAYQVSLDEILIGSDLGDVITIPEPASLGLLGLGGLVLGRRRRNA